MKAKLITRQVLADEAPDRWAHQYQRYASDSDKAEIGRQLYRLPVPRDPEAVDAVIGNSSWTRVYACDGCGNQHPDAVVQVGAAPGHDSATAYLCRNCINEAALLVFFGGAP